MNIVFRLDWQAVEGATTYLVQKLNSNGTYTDIATIEETTLDVTLDETVAAVYVVRAYDGSNYGPPVPIVYRPPKTLKGLRDEVRAKLRDESATKKYSDSELNTFLQNALDDYSKRFPRLGKVTIACTEDDRIYDLPTTLIKVTKVKYTDADGNEVHLMDRPYKGGEGGPPWKIAYWKLGLNDLRRNVRRNLGCFQVEQGVLSVDFDPAAGSSLEVTYTSPYNQLFLDAQQVEVPSEDQEMLVLYALGSATVRVEGQDANLSRWREDGRRDDNPMIDLSNRYFNAYMQRVKDKQEQNRPKVRQVYRVR